MYGFLTPAEIEPWQALLARLQDERRVVAHEGAWLAVERAAEFENARRGETEALMEILRSRLELLGPVTEERLDAGLDQSAGQIRAALLALESQGCVMRGRFGGDVEEWCDRRLLLRIHRYTRDRKRSEVQAVPPAQLMRFLFRWQRLTDDKDLSVTTCNPAAHDDRATEPLAPHPSAREELLVHPRLPGRGPGS